MHDVDESDIIHSFDCVRIIPDELEASCDW